MIKGFGDVMEVANWMRNSKEDLNMSSFLFTPINPNISYTFDSLMGVKTYGNLFTSSISEQYVQNIIKQVSCILCFNSKFFKKLSGKTKTIGVHGTAYPIKKQKDLFVFYCPEYSEIKTNPQQKELGLLCLNNAYAFNLGLPIKPKEVNINTITDLNSIKASLDSILNVPIVTVDIETFSLNHLTSKIVSIGFGIDTEHAFSFNVYLNRSEEEALKVVSLLRNFFLNYRGACVYHNCLFDVYILTYWLFMTGPYDYVGMYKGLDVLTKKIEDTKLIAYLCLNSCARPDLRLKTLSVSSMGDYAKDVSDIGKAFENREVSLEEILEYNAKDCIATWHVFNKYYPQLLKDSTQLNMYNTLYKKSLYNLLAMQLVGMSTDPNKINTLDANLNKEADSYLNEILNNPIVVEYTNKLKQSIAEKRNNKYKTKRISAEDVSESFNPGSSKQLCDLLYGTLHVRPKHFTENGLPSTNERALTSMLEDVSDTNAKALIENLINYNAVSTIIEKFIKILKRDTYKLYGQFNLGTVVSGRLSASDSLQQLPSTGTKYAKAVKECFVAPPGWIMVGIDYSSLEDYISALLTKDSNKLKVYMPIQIYKVEINGEVYYLSDDDTLELNGKLYKPSELIS